MKIVFWNLLDKIVIYILCVTLKNCESQFYSILKKKRSIYVEIKSTLSDKLLWNGSKFR